MCFPTDIMNNYIDTMYNIFAREIIKNPEDEEDDDQYTGNPLDIFNRDKYTIWIIAIAIIILFVLVCIFMLIIKIKRNKGISPNDDNENTPLLTDTNSI